MHSGDDIEHLSTDFEFFVLWSSHCQCISFLHGRLARWIKWKSCDVGEAKEGLENELWRRWSNWRVGEWIMTVKWRKGWRMDRARPSVALPTSQLILQRFSCFTYVTVHFPTLLSLLLPSQDLHLIHLASRPWCS